MTKEECIKNLKNLGYPWIVEAVQMWESDLERLKAAEDALQKANPLIFAAHTKRYETEGFDERD